IACAHNQRQWMNLFVAAATGALRSGDGLVYASSAARNLFERAWDDWCERLRPVPRPKGTVVLNGIEIEKHTRDEGLRVATRATLAIPESAVVFLCFSKVVPRVKGDFRALVALWKQIALAHPNAYLVVSGASDDRLYLEDLRTVARACGIHDRV